MDFLKLLTFFQLSATLDVGYHIVDIISKDRTEPAFFSYEVDTRLKKLKAEESITAWLYLACLHAYTSHLVADPFLDMSGTEMSLQILQSPRCWSCKPLSKSSLDILNNIAELAPHRTKKNAVEKINWPTAVPSLVAHDAFHFIAKQIVDDSERLHFAFEKNYKPVHFRAKNSASLASKAFYRSLDYYNATSSRLESCFADSLELLDEPKKVFERNELLTSFGTPQIANIRKICSANWRSYSSSDEEVIDFKNYFLSRAKELHLDPFKSDLSSKSLNDFYSKDLKDVWFQLYSFCKVNHLTETARLDSSLKLDLILSVFAYKGESLEHLIFFKYVFNYR